MRTDNDSCLLCDERKSIKKNSHIVPAFMTKSLLKGDKHNRAFLYSSDRTHLPTKYFQDSDKEDFILCNECETFFSILETYCSARVHNRLWDIRWQSQFVLEANDAGVTWKICKEVNPLVFRLFIYSIVWRCSIANTPTFQRFKILRENEDALRKCLKSCIRITQSTLLEDIQELKQNIPNLTFTLFTSESTYDKTANLIFCDPGKNNPYQLTLNEYILILSFDQNDMQEQFYDLNNFDLDQFIKIGFFPSNFWNDVKKDFVKKFTKKAIENLRKIGELPFFMKEKDIPAPNR